MTRKTLLILFFTLTVTSLVKAQEVITGLSENPVIIEALASSQQAGNEGRNSQAAEPLLVLPFFDDFQQSWIFPAESRWADDQVYINSNFGYHSANRGVATLDAIDGKGKLHANASTFPFGADTLTSQRIRLDSVFAPVARELTPADSVYLSFFYQPQGRANAPEEFDSLVLSFGYFTGDTVFSGYYDSIFVPLSDYIHPTDTLWPGDTVFSPATCDPGLYVICDAVYTYYDLIQVPCDSVFIPEYDWMEVWSSPGMTLNGFFAEYGTYSLQVMIPITDPLFFNKDFRFRFHNFASLASEYTPSWRGNCDQWNLDFIYLDRDRGWDDTTYRDVSFVERAPSVLANYEAMPYKQYKDNPTAEMKDNIEMVITNLDTLTYNTNFFYAVYQVDGPFQYLYAGGSCNLDPFSLNGYQNCISCDAHACPPTNFLFPLTDDDSAEFETRYYIIGDITPVDTISDTLRYRQKFHNYYAYDDGSPEEGYGLKGYGSSLAYQFKLNTKDTLRAVQMYFNRTVNNANEVFFDLMVWRDNNGKPGDALYTQPMQIVKFSDNLNEFQTYMLDEPLPVNGTIYIGWSQLSVENLNLGYDRYNNAQEHIFYNSDGTWNQSTYQGSLLMRPMLGKKFSPSAISEAETSGNEFRVYPNPVNGEEFYIRYSGPDAFSFSPSGYTIRITTLLGTEVYRGTYSESLRSVLPAPGLYLLQVLDRNRQQVFTTKIIKSR